MKKLTSKQKAKLDKEAQVFKCLVCDEEQVRWNGESWECGECAFLYSGVILEWLNEKIRGTTTAKRFD